MTRHLLVLLLCGLLTAACAERPPPPPLSPARAALAEHAPAGPMLAVVHGPTFGLDEAGRDALVTAELSRGVTGLDVEFTTDPARAATTDPRLVVVLNPIGNPPADLACTAPDRIATQRGAEEIEVLAVFCRGDEPLGITRNHAATRDLDTRAGRRLLWRTAGQVFPDDYPERYGLDIIPGIDVGIGGSFGF